LIFWTWTFERGRNVNEYEQLRPDSLPVDSSDVAAPDLGDLDEEWAEYVAWLDRESEAGRPVGPVEPESCDQEPWSASPWRPGFGQGSAADVLPPGPLLAGLTEEAVLSLDSLSDNELIGVLRATRRQVAREQYKQVLVTAEFGRRRRAAFEDAARRGVPVGCRPGGFPGEELAIELVTTRAEAGHRIDDAADLTTRLPLTLAGMAAGEIDEARAGWIAMYTRSLSLADAATADAILAADAPDLREEQVARKAAALEKKLAPEAVKARKERTRRAEQRVEARLEASGNASLSGREMDTSQVIASKAYLDAMAARLRAGGLGGTIGSLRVLALADLTQGRNPLDRLMAAATTQQATAPVSPESSGAGVPQPDPDAWPGWNTDDSVNPRDVGEAHDDGGPGGGGPGHPADSAFAHQGPPAPVPAQVNLIVPVGTLLGWSTSPAQAGSWGLLDRDETRAIIEAASRHPRTRWCCTLTGPDGTALAHACARGQHPRLLSDLEPQPPPAQLAELIRRLNLTFTPVATGTCDHAQAEGQYSPSRKLRHLVRARSATCDAPGCQSQAVNADLDHTLPWPDGPTEQCNLAPRCRTHHRAKQAPDWQVDQPAPGITRWTLPSGRTHTTTPTQYDAE
jgi:hypothetical protein